MSNTAAGKGWFAEKHRQRARRALERQLDYQEKKAESVKGREQEGMLDIFARARGIRHKLEKIEAIADNARVLEVGSGAHGLIFGFGGGFAVGIDPLAVDYHRLFPKWQEHCSTIAAIGEQLPFDDASFDVVLSDNVVDHAEHPVEIIGELVRVLKPGGMLFFTVNIHHPVYDLASRAHGLWNSLGIKFELSPFADHTIHFTEDQVRGVFAGLPLNVVSSRTTIGEMKAEYRKMKARNLEQALKKLFFKNALIEIIAIRNK